MTPDLRRAVTGSRRAESGPRPSRPAVLLVGHGTRDETGTEQFFQLAQLLGERLTPVPAAAALLEFQEPTIAQAWSDLASRGATHVHVSPLLLFAAGHAKQDIPQTLRECQRQTPSIGFDQARPISRHAAIIRLAIRRIGAAVARDAVATEETMVVMVGRGNRDPCAQADMRVLSEVVSRGLGLPTTTAFYAMAEPALPDVLRRVARSGRYRHVIVYPHLLFAGRLFDAIANQVSEAAADSTAIDFRLAEYLGPDPLVAEAIADRVDQIGAMPEGAVIRR